MDMYMEIFAMYNFSLSLQMINQPLKFSTQNLQLRIIMVHGSGS